jgi:alkylation response protein AidB-like acyl-CoA dehydrogenase
MNLPLSIESPMALSDELLDLRRSLRKFLESESNITHARSFVESDQQFDQTVWRQLAEEMGLMGLAIPEEYGGSGFGAAAQAIVLEELGRVLYCGPYVASAVLATQTLLRSGDPEAKGKYLPAIASGATVATVAAGSDLGVWTSGSPLTVRARPQDGEWRLAGVTSHVPDGGCADLFLVLAETENGPTMFAVEGTTDGVVRTELPTVDQTRPLSHLDLRDVAACMVGAEGAADDILRAVLDHAAIAIGAEQLGAASRCLEISVEYAKVREQFGEPVGRFQAIKHMCANMYLRVEEARSAVMFSSRAAEEGSDDVPLLASLVKVTCSEALFQCAADTVQVHGGIGFAWEADPQLYFKRAESSKLFLGEPAYHREQLAQRVGL